MPPATLPSLPYPTSLHRGSGRRRWLWRGTAGERKGAPCRAAAPPTGDGGDGVCVCALVCVPRLRRASPAPPARRAPSRPRRPRAIAAAPLSPLADAPRAPRAHPRRPVWRSSAREPIDRGASRRRRGEGRAVRPPRSARCGMRVARAAVCAGSERDFAGLCRTCRLASSLSTSDVDSGLREPIPVECHFSILPGGLCVTCATCCCLSSSSLSRRSFCSAICDACICLSRSSSSRRSCCSAWNTSPPPLTNGDCACQPHVRSNAPESARGPGSPLPHLHRDSAHSCHICTGTRLTPATSAPGLGSGITAL